MVKMLHLNLIYINIKQMLKTMELQHSPKKIRRQLKLHYNKDEKLLNLQGNKTWAALMECIKSPNIRKLWLGQCDINDGDLEAIAILNWESLQQLRLHDNKIHSGGIRKLILNSWPKLKLISLSRNYLGDEGCELFINLWQYFSHIQILSLNSNSVSGIGLRSIPEADFRELAQLSLDSNKIGHQGSKYLTKAKVPKLKKLFLGFCEIGDEGMKHLVKGNWPQLQYLRLNGNSISSTSHLDLLDSNWNKLKIANVDTISCIHLLKFVSKILKDKLQIDQELRNNRMRKNWMVVLGKNVRWW